MKIIKEISHAEFEAEFLRSEFYKNTFRNVRKKYGSLVNSNDYSVQSCDKRSLLLEIERGAFISRLPKGIHWYAAKINIDDFANARVIDEGSWRNVFGEKRKICDIVPLINSGIYDANHVAKISEIAHTLTDGDDDVDFGRVYRKNSKGKLIFLINQKKELTILEGNHRAIAVGLLSFRIDISSLFPLNVIIGDIGNKKCTWF